ncbi:MAG: YheC/YheD family protein [Bacillota bacterium]|nr:YheC/YheD family protein [Bacillota bacterium]
MITFGVLTLTMDSEDQYISEIAFRASKLGMECYRFIPSQINPNTHLVRGKRYDEQNASWVVDEFPIPTLLYDRCFYGDDDHSKQCIPIVSWLKNRDDLLFLGYGLPNKLELYRILNNSVISPYLVPSQSVKDIKIVLREITKQKRLILKPINGSQGRGIYYLKKNDKTYHVKTEKQKKIISRIFPNEIKLVQWLKQLIEHHEYFLQPYLELSNEALQPFDIRMLLQKDEHGNWVERGKGVRKGNTGGIISNLSAGGTVSDFDHWAQSLQPSVKEFIYNELEYIKQELPKMLEKEFMPLFELGVDIGITKNGAIWILDVNSKPGRKVVLSTSPNLEETLYLAPLLYGKLLSQTDQKERKRYHAQTLSD